MAYITRNTNLVLLFLILISAGGLVAATVFFQENFDRLNQAYDSKLQQLEQVTKDLQEKQAALQKIQNDLALKSAREEEFTQQYTSIREQKTMLEGEKEKLTKTAKTLEEKLESTRSELASTQNSLEAAKGENERLKADLAEAQADIIVLKRKIDTYEEAIENKDDKISCLQTKTDAEENTC